jgi:colanic acid biosynthesis protein WcaH
MSNAQPNPQVTIALKEPVASTKLPETEFRAITCLTPLVSIDLIIRSPTGEVWLGKRKDEPAKDYFFVLGGRVTKNEKLKDAFARITQAEVGIAMNISDARLLNVYEHVYRENRFGDQYFGTHYVVLAYEITVRKALSNASDEHNVDKRWWLVEELQDSSLVHQYTKDYFPRQEQQRELMTSEAQYKTMSDRRNHFNALLWQTPTLSITAQSFLLSVAGSSTQSMAARCTASLAAFLVAMCTLQLFAKHRFQEQTAATCLTDFERRNRYLGYVCVSGLEASGTQLPSKWWIVRWFRAFLRGEERRLRRFSSFRVWQTLLLLLVATAVTMIGWNVKVLLERVVISWAS